MSKKFSIVKTIDTDKLHYEVNSYVVNSGERNPYIFMSIDTTRAIASEFLPMLDLRTESKLDGYIAKYEGYKVFVDNELRFGEVEVR